MFSFQICRDPNPRLDTKGGSESELGLLRRFQLSYQNIFFMLFLFRFSICAEAFSNGRPINIYISQNVITMKAFSAFSNDIQNKTLIRSLTILFTKYSMFKKEMICIWRGIYLYAATCSMTLRFAILSSFLSTRNLRIDKNYTLSIFMLSSSIQFYFNIQFNLTCI